MRAIDADAFKDYIRGACEDMKHLYKDNGAWAKEITESFCKDIDEQPTIQPEPKRGRWIYKTDLITAPTGYWECSECKEGRLLYEENFCPHCGADMREVTNGN